MWSPWPGVVKKEEDGGGKGVLRRVNREREELGQDRESTGEKGFKTKPLEEPQDSEAVQKSSKSKCLFWISNLSVLDFEVFNRGINMLTRI